MSRQIAQRRRNFAPNAVAPAPVVRSAAETWAVRSAYDRSLSSLKQTIIKSIEFSVLGPEEIIRGTATTGGITATTPGTGHNEINSINMGVSAGNLACGRCKRGRMECDGHYGHIDFRNIGPEYTEPGTNPITSRGVSKVGLKLYHPLFMPWIVDMCTIICWKCNNIRKSDRFLALKGFLDYKSLDRECASTRSQPGLNLTSTSEDEETDATQEEEETEDLENEIEDGVGPEAKEEDIEFDDEDSLSAAATEQAAEGVGIDPEITQTREAKGEIDEEVYGIEDRESLFAISGHIHRMAEVISKQGNTCDNPNCQAVQPIIDFSASRTNFNIIYKKDKTGVSSGGMSIHEVYRILKSVTPEVQKKLQIVEPSRFIITVLPVLPPRLRPATPFKGGARMSFITNLYLGILGARAELDRMGFSLDVWLGNEINNEFSKRIKFIHDSISALMDNSKAISKLHSAPDSNMPTITQKITHKSGIVRNNMNGKRVRGAIRAPLVHVPGLDFNQVGMSEELAESSPKPEVCTTSNQQRLQALADIGKIKFYIRREDKIRHTVRKFPKPRASPTEEGKLEPYQIRLGDTVYRPLQTGDVVAHGRQPTIHKYNMMGYFVKIIKGLRGLGMALPVTMYKNADMDGDDTTIHVPYTPEAEAELATIMLADTSLLNAENNRVGIAQTFNALTAALHLTSRKDLVQQEVYKLLRKFITETYESRGEEKRLSNFNDRLARYSITPRSGAAIFSLLLPPTFSYTSKSVVIRDGILLRGNITDADVGRAENSITHRIALDPSLGMKTAVNFVNDANHFLNMYIENIGFSVGLQDCFLAPPSRTVDKPSITSTIKDIAARVEAEKNIRQAEIEVLRNQAKNSISDEENKRRRAIITEKLNVVSSLGPQLINIDPRNPIAMMVESGAKGSKTTYAQIVAQVGQQYNKGQIMEGPDGYEGRTLAYYHHEDVSIESGGYVTSSLAQGLTPREFFAHAWGSRESIVNTGVDTATWGDMQRRCIKSTEGTVIMPDGVVRDASTGKIIQGKYADGFARDRMFSVSVAGQNVLSFIDIKTVVAKINAKYMGEAGSII